MLTKSSSIGWNKSYTNLSCLEHQTYLLLETQAREEPIGILTWMCLIYCAIDDRAREHLSYKHESVNRAELDAHGSIVAAEDFHKKVMDYSMMRQTTICQLPWIHL
jgi:hypothetical protein